MNKYVVVLSEDDILYSSLEDNIQNSEIDLVHIKNLSEAKKFLSIYHKTVITIVDKWHNDASFIANFSKYVISFSPNQLKHSLLFKKPFRIIDLIREINKFIANDKLFCIINGNIYDERRSLIFFPKEILHLTMKENAVMKELLLSKDFFISREFLLKKIWKYSENSQTTTVESCMNKLRNKLPKNMLEQTNGGYQLFLESFL